MLGSAGPAGQAMSPQLGRSTAVGLGDSERLVCWVILHTEQQHQGGWTPMPTGTRLRLPLPRIEGFFPGHCSQLCCAQPPAGLETQKSLKPGCPGGLQTKSSPSEISFGQMFSLGCGGSCQKERLLENREGVHSFWVCSFEIPGLRPH